MSLMYERMVSAVIGTPAQIPAQWIKRLGQLSRQLRRPELAEILREDQRLRAVFEHFIRPGTHCVDVGGHLGSVTQVMCKLAPKGLHTVIEPVPYKADWLRRKFPDVAVHEVALSDRVGTTEFFVYLNQSGYSGLGLSKIDAPVKCIQVQMTTLDALIPADRRIGFLKVDVEGAELAVFGGARRILERDRPVILFECTNSCLANFGYAPQQIWASLPGYRVFLPKEAIAGPPLSFDRFVAAMQYPFQAFNFVACPVTQDCPTSEAKPTRDVPRVVAAQ